jgi:UDP-N-acetylglucosamine 2-epimerase
LKKILSVVGARPQFIKLAPLSTEVRKEFREIIVHTGQHYDAQMSDVFFEELNIPRPDYNLAVGSDSACRQIAAMLTGLEEIFMKEKPDCVIVFGDTNSTAAASIAAVKCGFKLAHVEAGLREFNKHIPEETNKLITDILSDFYFCPTETAVQILKSMGIEEGVYNVGDVMIDVIHQKSDEIKLNKKILDQFSVSPGEYVFMTCHRANNTDNVDNLIQILRAANQFKEKVIFPIHPRTMKVVRENGLEEYLKKLVTIDPIGYLDTQTLIHFAKFVYSDSGGVTKEAYFHKVPGILFDKQTEWVETIKEGWNIATGPDEEKILKAYRNMKVPSTHNNYLGDGTASKKIVHILKEALVSEGSAHSN